MTITPSALVGGGSLPAAASLLYAAPGNVQITSAVFTNRGAGVNNLTVYLGRAGTTGVGPGNVLINGQPLAPGQAFVSPELAGRNLAAGDFLYAFATNASQVNVIIDGFTVS